MNTNRNGSDYARFELPVRTGMTVDRLAKDGESYVVECGERRFKADNVVVATGFYGTPSVPGFATELMHLYLATGLREAGEGRRGPDQDEHLRLTAIPWRVALAMAEAGEIRDAKSLVALLWLARLRDSEVASPAVG